MHGAKAWTTRTNLYYSIRPTAQGRKIVDGFMRKYCGRSSMCSENELGLVASALPFGLTS
jgi:hypothetical protein